MKDTRKKTQKTPKKEKTKKKQFETKLCYWKDIFAKRKKHIHTERENSEKRETWKHTEIIIKSGKSRNKEDIFFRR